MMWQKKFKAAGLLVKYVLALAAGILICLFWYWSPHTFPQKEAERKTDSSPYTWPAQGELTSGYGMRWGRMHKGIDIAAPVGTPIVAAAPGTVVYSQWNEWGYGYSVEILHSDGTVTFYAHHSSNAVSVGEEVSQGQQIAEMGSTGLSTGPHLHFEIHPPGREAADPVEFLPKS